MSRYQVAYSATTKEALIQPYGAATVAGHANIGSFYHDGGGADVLGPDTDIDTHVLYHHVRDLLYAQGELNMAIVNITFKHVTAISATPPTVTKAAAQTQQITTAFTPADASNQDLLYSSSDPTKATVNATGLITAVATGTATITVTSKDGGFTDTVVMTIS